MNDEQRPDLNSNDAFLDWLQRHPEASCRAAWDAGRLHYISRLKAAARAIVNKTTASILHLAMNVHDTAETTVRTKEEK